MLSLILAAKGQEFYLPAFERSCLYAQPEYNTQGHQTRKFINQQERCSENMRSRVRTFDAQQRQNDRLCGNEMVQTSRITDREGRLQYFY